MGRRCLASLALLGSIAACGTDRSPAESGADDSTGVEIPDMPPEPAVATRAPLGDTDEADWYQARERVRSLMREAALEQRAQIVREEMLVLDRQAAVWRYVVTTDRDLRSAGGKTTLTVDARTGERLFVQWPTGAHAGKTVETWLSHLHMARVGGLPVRLLVSVIGLVVVVLSITGVGIWWRKWQGRRQATRTGYSRTAETVSLQRG